MTDDATSVPGSLFGNIPINQSTEQPPRSGVTADDDTQSYVDFYARLGGSRAGNRSQTEASATSRRMEDGDDLEASLLGSGVDAANSRFDLRPPAADFFTKHRKNVRLLVAGSVMMMIIIMLWWVTGGGRQVDPPAWEAPDAYQVSFVMTLASGLEEPGVAMVDRKAGAMRVSYYSGMTTYIINETGSSWSIVPRLDRLMCFEESRSIKLQHVFPDTKRFKYVRQRDLVLTPRGAKAVGGASPEGKKKKKSVTTCEEWVYHPPTRHGENGYIGTYTLWTTPGLNGVPVRFSFVGHNMILGSSHYDNYTIDYYNFRNLANNEGGIDPIWLKPPHGMPCINVTETQGPTKASSQVASIRSLFPENTDVRDVEYDRFHAMYSTKEKTVGRNAIFQQTLRLIQSHNRDASKSYKLGLNFMADWTFEERESWVRVGMKRRSQEEVLQSPLAVTQNTMQDMESKFKRESHCSVEEIGDLLAEYANTTLPREVDHVKGGLTLPPGEQGTCGSSWAFAATGCIEGQMAKKTGKPPISLSEQNIMDCSLWIPYMNHGCNGGEDHSAYAWAIEHNHGQVATEASYPFLNQDGFCHFDLKRELVSDGAHAQPDAPRITECVHISDAFKGEKQVPSSDDLVKSLNLRLFTQGPLSVSIDASPHDFYFYESGIYNNPDCKSGHLHLDHAVLAVGYNLNGPEPYTVVRNHWGTFWGEKGYARISQKDNLCGVATAATYVHLEGDTSHPTHTPTAMPTTLSPTKPVTAVPTASPTKPKETNTPTLSPTKKPTEPPSAAPSKSPTRSTSSPSPNPTRPNETYPPTFSPSKHPSMPVTGSPTTSSPLSEAPTKSPTKLPTTSSPVSEAPTLSPTKLPTTSSPISQAPTLSPTKLPITSSPVSQAPTLSPTKLPTKLPTTSSPVSEAPTKSPTKPPTSTSPTNSPTTRPPTDIPTTSPPTTSPPTTSPPTDSPSSIPPTTPPSST